MVLILTYTFIGLRMWNSKVPGEIQYKPSQTTQNNSTHYSFQSTINQIDRRHESVKKV